MMTRKQFLRRALELSAATFGLTVLSACGGSPTPTPDGGPGVDARPGGSAAGRCAMDGTSSTIGDNHGHVLVVPMQDVAAGVDVTYHIQGTSDHDHTVVLRAADFASLQQDRAIMTTSSFDADHSHAVMVACA
ncbi:MAG: hypothetical protein ACM31C_10115 [Acidobacteriota bacterium]